MLVRSSSPLPSPCTLSHTLPSSPLPHTPTIPTECHLAVGMLSDSLPELYNSPARTPTLTHHTNTPHTIPFRHTDRHTHTHTHISTFSIRTLTPPLFIQSARCTAVVTVAGVKARGSRCSHIAQPSTVRTSIKNHNHRSACRAQRMTVIMKSLLQT